MTGPASWPARRGRTWKRLNARRREDRAGEPSSWWACNAAAATRCQRRHRQPGRGLLRPICLVRAGATVMFSETTEVRDAVEQLTSRAATPELAQRIVDETGLVRRLPGSAAGSTAAPTPRRATRPAGLSNIVEKAMGSIVKSGQQRPFHGRAVAGRESCTASNAAWSLRRHAGFSDFICGTLQLAAGMNLHVFTTGRGTPYGLAACPVVKVATRTELWRVAGTT